MKNPLLIRWSTPFETPPFDEIKTEHFKPAIEEAIRTASLEIQKISENNDSPSFENTIGALEESGETLGRISSILFNLNNAETNKDLQMVAQEVSPLLTRFSNDITLNEKLFKRIKSIYDNKDTLALNTEQKILIGKRYRSFKLGGAGLKEDEKIRFREISEELATLSLRFEENVLEETNSWTLHSTDRNELTGLPESVIEMAGAEANNRSEKGWIFTLHYPSYVPFMQYSEQRELREKMFRAYASRAFKGNNSTTARTQKG